MPSIACLPTCLLATRVHFHSLFPKCPTHYACPPLRPARRRAGYVHGPCISEGACLHILTACCSQHVLCEVVILPILVVEEWGRGAEWDKHTGCRATQRLPFVRLFVHSLHLGTNCLPQVRYLSRVFSRVSPPIRPCSR